MSEETKSEGARAPTSIKTVQELSDFIEQHQWHLTVVLFIEDWSENCASTYNTLVELANDNATAENVAFCEIVAENSPDICDAYKVIGVPTVIFFRKMQEVDRVTGIRVREVASKLKFHAINNIVSSTLRMGEPATNICGGEMSETSEINGRIKELISQSEIMVFIKGTPAEPKCGFSRTIIGILNETGMEYGSFNILLDDDIRQGLKIYSNWHTYPQLYVRGTLVGGLDIVRELKESGDLMTTLTE